MREAVRRIEADFQCSSNIHVIAVPLPGLPGVDLYLKDESSHPTGSLKHWLARSLFLHALCNGWLHAGSTVVEASSGSTAISEAYFARLLGLPFIAVMPASVEERNSCDCRTNILRLGRRAAAGSNPPSDRIASTHRGGNASCPAM